MNATEMKTVELRCPKCGSNDIVEWNNVPTRYGFDRVETDGKGNFAIEYNGIYEPVTDACEVTGYSCRNYCVEAPLEEFVVGTLF